MRSFTRFLQLTIAFCPLSFSCIAAEIFDPALESLTLKNIRQLTFPSMGFEREGEAYFSLDGQTIIFQAVPKGEEHYQIYTLDLNNGTPQLVSTGKGACTCSNFRPDGKKIIFASSHTDPTIEDVAFETKVPGYQRQGSRYSWTFTPYMNIYEANPDRTDLLALTSGPYYHAECAYSSDGRKIVFASNSDGNMNLYTMDCDGTNLYQVTKTLSGYNRGPFFSPDNTKIIFRADYDRPDYLQIYEIDADGSNIRQLTNSVTCHAYVINDSLPTRYSHNYL